METWLTAVQLQRGRTQSTPSLPRPVASDLPDHRVPSKIDLGKIKPWHERLVDFMLMNPTARAKEMAEHFGVTIPWLSTMMKTDAFKAYYQSRAATHQEMISAQVISKVQGVAMKSLDKLAEKLDKPDVPLAEVRQTAEMAIKALGYGTTARGPSVQVNVSPTQQANLSVMAVPANVLAEARQRMAAQREANTEDIPDTRSEYMRVTASLDITPETIKDGVEDAVIVASGTDSADSNE